MSIWRTVAAAALAAVVCGSATLPPHAGLVAHEWGTFTSVADREGNPVEWQANSGPVPLPCFVHNYQEISKLNAPPTTVRMETPVIYFYAPSATTVSADVTFRRGHMTEWYPAAQYRGRQLVWNSVEVLPGEDLAFPHGKSDNHYYAARRTDGAPLRAGKEQEKLLFYRGVGDLSVPVRPRFVGSSIEIQTAGQAAVPAVILFENRGGKAGYRVVGEVKGPVLAAPPELTGDVADLRRELTASLVAAGLYPKEAEAMLETWRDSWFEEGMRVIYIVPREIVDAELPLTITPQPADTARVFVGRVEMLSPAVEQEITDGVMHRDRSIYGKYARFLEPFVTMIRPNNPAVAAAFRGDLSIGATPCAR